MIGQDKDHYKISGCLQENKLGHIESKLEEHSKDIDELKKCVEHKRRRLDNLEIVDATTLINFNNLEKRVVAKELKDDQRHVEMMSKFTEAIDSITTKFAKMESQLFQIKWIISGFALALSLVIFLVDKLPVFIKNLSALLL